MASTAPTKVCGHCFLGRASAPACATRSHAPEDTGGDRVASASVTPHTVPHPALQDTTAQELARGGAGSTAPPLCRPRHHHGGDGQRRAGAALVSGEEGGLVCRP